MPKIPQCDALRAGFAHRCLLYAHNPHLICAVHPDGVDGDCEARAGGNAEFSSACSTPARRHRCLDFRPNSKGNVRDSKSSSQHGTGDC